MPSNVKAATCNVRLILGIGLALSTGCGSAEVERGAVHGKVTIGGKPIEQGTIVFHPLPPLVARPAGGDIVNGSYSITENGPALGTHRVEIQAYRKTGRKVPDIMGDLSIPNRPLVDETVPLLPPTYNLESTLTAEITSSDNTVNFDL